MFNPRLHDDPQRQQDCLHSQADLQLHPETFSPQTRHRVRPEQETDQADRHRLVDLRRGGQPARQVPARGAGGHRDVPGQDLRQDAAGDAEPGRGVHERGPHAPGQAAGREPV